MYIPLSYFPPHSFEVLGLLAFVAAVFPLYRYALRESLWEKHDGRACTYYLPISNLILSTYFVLLCILGIIAVVMTRDHDSPVNSCIYVGLVMSYATMRSASFPKPQGLFLNLLPQRVTIDPVADHYDLVRGSVWRRRHFSGTFSEDIGGVKVVSSSSKGAGSCPLYLFWKVRQEGRYDVQIGTFRTREMADQQAASVAARLGIPVLDETWRRTRVRPTDLHGTSGG